MADPADCLPVHTRASLEHHLAEGLVVELLEVAQGEHLEGLLRHRPEAFDGVERGGVAGQEEREEQPVQQSLVAVRSMGAVVVHDEHGPPGPAVLQLHLVVDAVEEVAEVEGVGGVGQQEHGLVHARRDGPIHRHEQLLRVDVHIDRPVLEAPRLRLAILPRAEARLVTVDHCMVLG